MKKLTQVLLLLSLLQPLWPQHVRADGPAASQGAEDGVHLPILIGNAGVDLHQLYDSICKSLYDFSATPSPLCAYGKVIEGKLIDIRTISNATDKRKYMDGLFELDRELVTVITGTGLDQRTGQELMRQKSQIDDAINSLL